VGGGLLRTALLEVGVAAACVSVALGILVVVFADVILHGLFLAMGLGKAQDGWKEQVLWRTAFRVSVQVEGEVPRGLLYITVQVWCMVLSIVWAVWD
jgi:hypothetical protein